MTPRRTVRLIRMFAKYEKRMCPVYWRNVKVGDVLFDGTCQNLVFPKDNRRVIVGLIANAGIRDKVSRKILAITAQKLRLGIL